MNLTQVQNQSATNGEILSLLAQGLAPKEIAAEVKLTDVAVHSRLARIRAKCGVQTNTALVGMILEARWKNQEKSRRAA